MFVVYQVYTLYHSTDDTFVCVCVCVCVFFMCSYALYDQPIYNMINHFLL